MSDPETRAWSPTRTHILWLAVSLTLVLIPHVPRCPPWITAGFALLALWRIEHAIHGVRLPSRWAQLLLSIAIVGGVFLSYGTLFGRNAGIGALAILSGMKLLETNTLRDAYATACLGFFLIITNFLYSQTIPTGLYMLVVVWVLTASLIAINRSDGGRRVSGCLRHAGLLLAQALPLMLVLFVLFPRIPGPLWGLPKDAGSAASGLSETMSPGAISQLGLSSAVAFRVAFDGPIPPPAQLYWRGPVFSKSDGRVWWGEDPRLNREVPSLDGNGRLVHYTLSLEAHQQHWVFALDVPGTVGANLRITDAYQLISTSRVRERRIYRLGSYLGARITHLSREERQSALELPPDFHPRARALAEQWLESSPSAEVFVQTALRYFRTQPFYYTLRPPLLLGDPVDEFLFQSRRGFCEHYAAAFTVLMRAGGIPARVVTGYQGGDINPLGDYLIVRQRDAHAWVEAWLDGVGWTRIDPTAAVSPERIELGMEAALPSPIGPAAFALKASGPLAGLVRGLRHAWDTVNNSWNQWVLGYGPARQREFLTRLGLQAMNWRIAASGLLAGSLGLFCVLGVWAIQRRVEPDPVVRAYRRFCRKLSKLGLERRPSEGPRDFAGRVARARPEAAEPVHHITDLYVDIRYAGTGAPVSALRRAVVAFRPRRGL